MKPEQFRRHAGTGQLRFLTRQNRQPDGWSHEVFGFGLDVICVCRKAEHATMIAEALEATAERNECAFGLRVPQTQTTGIAAIIGKWPGDETDEEINAALKEMS